MSACPIGSVVSAMFSRGDLPLLIERVGGQLDGVSFRWDENLMGYTDDAGHCAPAFVVRSQWLSRCDSGHCGWRVYPHLEAVA